MIAICLDLVLITLLLLAVWIGLRLEKRLKVLRGSQEGFVTAVAELNAGVDKAQAGLVELKSATLEARTELADRIQDAKGMTARLERQAAAAEQAIQRLEAVIERAAQVKPVAARDFPQPAHPRESRDPGVFGIRDRSAGQNRSEDEPLILRREALSQSERGSGGSTRSKARVDDDLFDGPLGMFGGRR
jgi:hypothetical protein